MYVCMDICTYGRMYLCVSVICSFVLVFGVCKCILLCVCVCVCVCCVVCACVCNGCFKVIKNNNLFVFVCLFVCFFVV